MKTAAAIAVVTLVLAFSILGNGGARPIVIEGRVVRDDPQAGHTPPVPDASVSIDGDSVRTITDANGRFRLESRRRIGEGAEFYVLNITKGDVSIRQRMMPADLRGIVFVLPSTTRDAASRRADPRRE